MPFALEQHQLSISDVESANRLEFLQKMEKIRAKQVVIGVIGLGYVGLPLSLVFAEEKVKVIGFDIDEKKIQNIRAGQSYIHYISNQRLKRVVEEESFFPTADMPFVAECDVIIICVPTPPQPPSRARSFLYC